MKEQQCQSCKRTIVNGDWEYVQCGVCTVCMQRQEDAQYKLTWQEKLYCRLFKGADRDHTKGRGPDPYAGEWYTFKLWKLEVQAANVICYVVEIKFFGKSIYRSAGDTRKELGWIAKFFTDVASALERQYELNYQCDEYVEYYE